MDMAEIGVRRRARALASEVEAESSGAAKRRKVGGEEAEFSSSLVEFSGRRQVTENSVSAECLTDPDDQYSDHVTTSCCSSNGSTELSNEDLQFPDLEQESVGIQNLADNSVCTESIRETTPVRELGAETEEMESTARPSTENSRRQSAAEKMPSEAELEEFFSVAEKDLEKKFTEKYNFDIVNDKPLEGRYEWVRLKS